MQMGYTPSFLANTISDDYKRVRFHGVKDTVIQDQAAALGIPLLQQSTRADNYEEDYKNNIKAVKNIDGLVFGDIFLQDCLVWANKVAKDMGTHAIEPLWDQKPLQLLKDFITAGFSAIIVSTQADLLGKEWVGRKIDQSFITDIKKLPNIDPCGENGEYHSLVIDGPIFKKRIKITKAEKILRNGYWFYDIQKYQVEEK
jgi:diphthine-ammonia ligase